MVGEFFRLFRARLSCLNLTLLGDGLGILLQVEGTAD